MIIPIMDEVQISVVWDLRLISSQILHCIHQLLIKWAKQVLHFFLFLWEQLPAEAEHSVAAPLFLKGWSMSWNFKLHEAEGSYIIR